MHYGCAWPATVAFCFYADNRSRHGLGQAGRYSAKQPIHHLSLPGQTDGKAGRKAKKTAAAAAAATVSPDEGEEATRANQEHSYRSVRANINPIPMRFRRDIEQGHLNPVYKGGYDAFSEAKLGFFREQIMAGKRDPTFLGRRLKTAVLYDDDTDPFQPVSQITIEPGTGESDFDGDVDTDDVMRDVDLAAMSTGPAAAATTTTTTTTATATTTTPMPEPAPVAPVGHDFDGDVDTEVEVVMRDMDLASMTTGPLAAPTTTTTPTNDAVARRSSKRKSGESDPTTVQGSEQKRSKPNLKTRRCVCGQPACEAVDGEGLMLKVTPARAKTWLSVFSAPAAPQHDEPKCKPKSARHQVHGYVHVCHFRLDALKLSGSGHVLLTAPREMPALQPAWAFTNRDDFKLLVAERHTATARRDVMCICQQGEFCDHNVLDKTLGGYHHLPSDRDAAKKWVTALVGRDAASLRQLYVGDTEHALVARHHFSPSQLYTSASGRVYVIKGEVPRPRPYSEAELRTERSKATPAAASAERQTTRDMRGLMGEDAFEMFPQAAEKVSKRLREAEAEQRGAVNISSTTCEAPKWTKRDENGVAWFSVLSAIKASPANCQYYTGEPSYHVLIKLLEYMNAGGAMSQLTTVRNDRDQDDGTRAFAPRCPRPGAPAKEPRLIERFVMFMICLRRFRSDPEHVGNMFGVSGTTVRRNYCTWVLAWAYFFRHQQPMPSAAQVARVTPAQVRARIGLDPHSAFLYGDCTERFTQDSGDKAVHAALFSEYKNHTTAKVLTILVGNTYMCHISEAYCGGITDTALHICDGIADLLPVFERQHLSRPDGSNCSTHARTVYVYDRGLTSVTALERKNIRCLTPPSADVQKQKQFSSTSGQFGKAVATIRIHVERVNRQLREYAAFQALLPADQFDLASAENAVCRGLINLKPEAHCHVQDSCILSTLDAKRGMDLRDTEVEDEPTVEEPTVEGGNVAAPLNAETAEELMEAYVNTNLD